MNAHTFSRNSRFANFENNFSDEKFRRRPENVAGGFALVPPCASDDFESAFDAIFV